MPLEWLVDVKAANEDSLLDLTDHLPGEAAEALLELATGSTPAVPEVASKDANPFQHPDAQRRFRIMSDMDELKRALEYPWDKWTVFLHPAQRQLVDRTYNGAARVSGSAGTGKTVVALHRAVHLAHKDEDARVLLATFSDTLANALRGNLYRLIWGTPKLGERIDVLAMDAIGILFYVIPGLIAFGIDFATGAIYYKGGHTAQIDPAKLRDAVSPDGTVDNLKLQAILESELGQRLPLDDPRLIQHRGSVEQLASLGLVPAA